MAHTRRASSPEVTDGLSSDNNNSLPPYSNFLGGLQQRESGYCSRGGQTLEGWNALEHSMRLCSLILSRFLEQYT